MLGKHLLKLYVWLLLKQILPYKHFICFSCKYKSIFLLFLKQEGFICFNEDGLKLTS